MEIEDDGIGFVEKNIKLGYWTVLRGGDVEECPSYFIFVWSITARLFLQDEKSIIFWLSRKLVLCWRIRKLFYFFKFFKLKHVYPILTSLVYFYPKSVHFFLNIILPWFWCRYITYLLKYIPSPMFQHKRFFMFFFKTFFVMRSI